MSNIICTGGAGFIGSHLVDKLIDLGHSVIVIDDLSTGNIKNINPKADFINGSVCDFLDAERCKRFFQFYPQIDFIFHLAAQINLRNSFVNPSVDAHTNIVGSLNVISLAKQYNARLIFASTGGALYSEESPIPWTIKSKIDPKSPYGLAKHTVERYLNISGVKHTILRLSNVYGPRQNHKGEAGVISIFINNILNNQNLTIFGDGTQQRDFVYVDDVVNAFVIAMGYEYSNTYNVAGGTYNVATGIGTDITTIAQMIIDGMGSNKTIQYKEAIPGEIKNSIIRNNLAGWRETVDLKGGIARTIRYFSDI
jgi:UDP-glucose 4-epimerase